MLVWVWLRHNYSVILCLIGVSSSKSNRLFWIYRYVWSIKSGTMDYFNSPSNKAVDNIQYPEEMKFKTPKNNRTPQRFSSSPDFAPFNVSSPVKSNWKFNNYRGARNKRYFNTTDSGSSHSGNFNSPFNKHRRMGVSSCLSIKFRSYLFYKCTYKF